jgi:hypothetical protein
LGKEDGAVSVHGISQNIVERMIDIQGEDSTTLEDVSITWVAVNDSGYTQ